MVIDGQLFSLSDGPFAYTQDVAVPDDRPDVGIATVIYVLGTAAADRAVERPVFVQGEKVDHAPLFFAAAPRLFPADTFAGVFQHLAASRDVLRGVDAPAVNLRGFDLKLEICIVLIDCWWEIDLAPGHFKQLYRLT